MSTESDNVETMLNNVLTGAQEYNVSNRRVVRPRLSELMKARDMLLAEDERNGGTNPLITVGRITRPT